MSVLRHIHSPKAFTLMELVIVMAIMSIMVMMVVSFTMLCNAWSSWGTNRYNLTATERQSETLLRQFVSYYDNTDYYFTTASNNAELVAVCAAEPYKQYRFYYDNDDVIEYERLEGENAYCNVEFLRTVRFAVRTNSHNQQLILMRISYELPYLGVGGRDTAGTYEVLVCSRAMGAHA